MSATIDIDSLSAAQHLLQHSPERCLRLIIPPNGSPRLKDLELLAQRAKVMIDKGANFRLVVKNFEYRSLESIISDSQTKARMVLLALDHLQDPQNLGALCRSAEGLGVSGVLLPKHRGVLITPGVYSASAGAVETIPILLVNNLSESLRKFKDVGFWIIGTSMDPKAPTVDEIPDYEKVVLVLGAEWDGMASGTEKACDLSVRIPLKGKIQSLNVSAAGAILLYQLMKRHQ